MESCIAGGSPSLHVKWYVMCRLLSRSCRYGGSSTLFWESSFLRLLLPLAMQIQIRNIWRHRVHLLPTFPRRFRRHSLFFGDTKKIQWKYAICDIANPLRRGRRVYERRKIFCSDGVRVLRPRTTHRCMRDVWDTEPRPRSAPIV